MEHLIFLGVETRRFAIVEFFLKLHHRWYYDESLVHHNDCVYGPTKMSFPDSVEPDFSFFPFKWCLDDPDAEPVLQDMLQLLDMERNEPNSVIHSRNAVQQISSSLRTSSDLYEHFEQTGDQNLESMPAPTPEEFLIIVRERVPSVDAVLNAFPETAEFFIKWIVDHSEHYQRVLQRHEEREQHIAQRANSAQREEIHAAVVREAPTTGDQSGDTVQLIGRTVHMFKPVSYTHLTLPTKRIV